MSQIPRPLIRPPRPIHTVWFTITCNGRTCTISIAIAAGQTRCRIGSRRIHSKARCSESNIKTNTQEVPDTLGEGPAPPAGANSASSTGKLGRSRQCYKTPLSRGEALTNSDERVEDQKRLAKRTESGARRLRRGNETSFIRIVRRCCHRSYLIDRIFFDSWLKRLLNKVRLDSRQADTLHAVISTECKS